MQTKTFTYISDIQQEKILYSDISTICRENRFDRQLTNKILIVMNELFNNAVIHGNKCMPDKKVRVAVQIKNNAFFADIIDEGVNGYNRISGRKKSNADSEGGRGVDIVEHYCDRLAYVEMPEGGLKVTVSISLAQETIKK